MTKDDFLAVYNKFHGLPPDLEIGTHLIVKCDCGKAHGKLFKTCPGLTLLPKSAKQLKKEREQSDPEIARQALERTEYVRDWRRKNGKRPTTAERTSA